VAAKGCYLTGKPMKKLVFIVVSVLALSCGKQEAEQPKKLLSEEQMVNMLYDISILQAINSYSPSKLDSSKVDARNYIYKKYKTDSLTFAQNHQYYASDLDVYADIQKKVAGKIEQDKIKYGIKKKETAKDSVKAGTSGPKIRKRTK